MLRIDMQSANSIATLVCSGRLVLGVETETLRTMVQSRREKRIRVDLAAVDKIDASGLGLLVELQVWAHDAGRTLTLSNLLRMFGDSSSLPSFTNRWKSPMPMSPELSNDFGRNELIA